jgi:hypothetical protein
MSQARRGLMVGSRSAFQRPMRMVEPRSLASAGRAVRAHDRLDVRAEVAVFTEYQVSMVSPLTLTVVSISR